MISKSLRARTNLFIVFIVLFNPLGNTFLREGMNRTGAPARWTSQALALFFWRAFQSGSVWIGMCLLMLFLICYMLVLSWADYSYVQPASALGYAMVPVLGYLTLGEVISPLRWIAVLFICAGVALVGGTEQRTVGE